MTLGRGTNAAAIAAVCVAAVAACGGSGGHAQADQVFLQATAQDASLSAVDVSTRVQLGHEMCELLGKYHGNSDRADQAFASGYEATFTPPVVADLRAAATVAYCQKWA
jgi:hypothetical protein